MNMKNGATEEEYEEKEHEFEEGGTVEKDEEKEEDELQESSRA